MHRFFVATIDDNQVTFSDEQAHQMRQVLRMAVGDRVVALVDGAGWEVEAELVQVDKKGVTAVALEKRPVTTEPTIQLTLYACLLKRDNYEWVLQKGTEIGVSRFVPLISERTVAQPPKKWERWQRIVTEAAEQSGRGCIPEIMPPQKLADVLAGWPPDAIGLMPAVAADGVTIGSALAQAEPVEAGALVEASVFIGPEGGWTDDEVANGRSAGLIPVTLGKRILRAETASIVAATLVIQTLD
ncbi:MAG: 16S rRNA (uracil(1498)-N(3))-methyltransferase [Anaerolineae bacterium]|nr:16S rRNA (uracil(1498)-N(3))-methyltransferase [Anaerolineae bacterium]